jgi:hypothetical protein
MAILGLLAFAIAIFGGMIVGNDMSFILAQALWAMLIFSGVGLGVGWAASHVVREYRDTQFEEVFGYPEGQPPEETPSGESDDAAPVETTVAEPIMSRAG